jgi:hypothetical protein
MGLGVSSLEGTRCAERRRNRHCPARAAARQTSFGGERKVPAPVKGACGCTRYTIVPRPTCGRKGGPEGRGT